jgi:hypothetical protein
MDTHIRTTWHEGHMVGNRKCVLSPPKSGQGGKKPSAPLDRDTEMSGLPMGTILNSATPAIWSEGHASLTIDTFNAVIKHLLCAPWAQASGSAPGRYTSYFIWKSAGWKGLPTLSGDPFSIPTGPEPQAGAEATGNCHRVCCSAVLSDQGVKKGLTERGLWPNPSLSGEGARTSYLLFLV